MLLLLFLSRDYSMVRPRVSAPPEVSAFLHGLVYRAAPRGLSDPAEDVCAAAARAVRLVMRRFLPPVEAGRDNNGGEAGLTLAPAGRQRRERGPTDGGKGEAEMLRSYGGGGEVFDLVWKALEDLDQDSTCVEVRADRVCCVCMTSCFFTKALHVLLLFNTFLASPGTLPAVRPSRPGMYRVSLIHRSPALIYSGSCGSPGDVL